MVDIPEFLKKMLLEQYDENLVNKIIQGLNYQKPLTLRVNKIKANREEIIEVFNKEKIVFDEVNWYKDAFIIENVSKERIQKLDIYEEGKIYLQSLSSMIPALILNPKENENILDMCSAPGGKTTQMSSISHNKAIITACERNKIRGEKLKFNLQKQGAGTVNVMLEDARNLSDYFSFDKILLDAPCSGSGTDNVFKDNFTEELIKKSFKTQMILLKKALNILKPKSEMIYSTCSILSCENEEVLKNVLKSSKTGIVPIDRIDGVPYLETKLEGTLCIMPNELYEGFFIAKIRKK